MKPVIANALQASNEKFLLLLNQRHVRHYKGTICIVEHLQHALLFFIEVRMCVHNSIEKKKFILHIMI